MMKKIIFSASFVLAICLLSCKKEQDNSQSSKITHLESYEIPAELKPVGEYLAQTHGVKIEDIDYIPADSTFVMQGDMAVRLLSAKEDMKNQVKPLKMSSVKEQGSGAGAISHRKHTVVADLNYYPTIKIFNNCTSSQWFEATSQAIRNWNHPNVRALTKIRMVEVSSPSGASCEVREKGVYSGNGDIARGVLPFSVFAIRKVGNFIDIYKDGDYYAKKRKEVVITHELGHIIGFRHNDATDAALIDGTPVTNLFSIMNSGTTPGYTVANGDHFRGFTTADLWAMYFLHGNGIPGDAQVPGTAKNLAGGDNGYMYATDLTQQPDGTHYFKRWNGSGWNLMTQTYEGRGIKMATTTGGQYYYITADKKIWQGQVFPNPIQLPGEAIDIAANSSGELFIVSNTYHSADGNKIMKWNGTGWAEYQPVPGFPTVGGKKIALPAGPNASPFVVKNSGEVVYYWPGNTNWASAGSTNALDIAACNYMNDISGLPIVYIIDGAKPAGDNYKICRWTGNDWYDMPGGGRTIAVGPDGHPWHTSSQNNIYTASSY